jgi:hypothetical protein
MWRSGALAASSDSSPNRPHQCDLLSCVAASTVVFTTDSGAEALSWPGGCATPFGGEKDTKEVGGLHIPCGGEQRKSDEAVGSCAL